MKWIKLLIEDITMEHIEFCDKYIKRTLINQRHSYYRPAMRISRLNIIVLGLETVEDELACEENGFKKICTTHIDVSGERVPVHNSYFAEVLMEMPENLRTVLLRNQILNHKLKDIAKDLGVSAVMAGKYRDKAVAFIKERMKDKL